MKKDTNKDIIIRIVDKHSQENEEEDSELITVGKFTGSSDNYSIVYTECGPELESCETTIEVVGQKKIIMTRTGKYTTEMIMEENKRHNCHYVTPFGSFFMGVYASFIESEVHNGAGELNFRYTLDFNSSNSTQNELFISFGEAKKDVPFS